jgi:flagellar assembly factor FliW
MSYTVRGEILGFENTKKVSIHKIDDLFQTLKDEENEHISFTLVNPYMLREYSFDVPAETQTLLEITPESKVSVYNILVIQKPLEDSIINFLAPLIINHDNNTLTQIVLDPKDHPEFGIAEPIKSFKK